VASKTVRHSAEREIGLIFAIAKSGIRLTPINRIFWKTYFSIVLYPKERW
jgi:hypothetical protein